MAELITSNENFIDRDVFTQTEKITTKNSLTIFMYSGSYSIDILFLDENYRIIKAYKRVKPFTFYIKGIKSRYIVELRNSKNLNAGEIFKI